MFRRVILFALVSPLLLLSGGVSATDRLPSFADLVEHEYRAVVNISTSRSVDPREGRLPPGFSPPEEEDSDDPLRRFFGDERGPPFPDDAAARGSGFILSADGYILTNAHVVENADSVLVRLHDRRQYEAEVVGGDPRSDIALLRVDASELPTVRLGDPEELRVGDWVAAIGSPFGFDHSVTAGIVSAKHRSLPTDHYVPYIQTDVAINPGNSGGPLFNLDGEVIGVNAQIFSRTGGFMGLSFAIPIDVAKEVAEQLRTEGRVVRGWLGVVIQEVTHELAQSFDMERARGALVTRVIEDSPADATELETGDIIIRFDGREIARSSDLPPMVGRSRVGEEVDLDIIRQGERLRLSVRIGELADDAVAREEAPEDDAPAEGNNARRLGMQIGPVPASIRRELGVESGGVLVDDLHPGAALDAGIRRGDVIIRLDNIPVESVDSFHERVAGLEPGRSVAVLVERPDGAQFIAIEVPEDRS